MEQEILIERLNESEMKALDSLARYKFEMFGYWASTWVKYNQLAYDMRIINKKKPNPFKWPRSTRRIEKLLMNCSLQRLKESRERSDGQ